MPFYEMRVALAREVASALRHPELTAEPIAAEFTPPPGSATAHLALPCFRIAKVVDKNPEGLALELAALFPATGEPATGRPVASASGPYVYFRWDAADLFSRVIGTVLRERDRYGTDETGHGKSVVLEYCSANVAQRLMVKHLRSTVIGNALAGILQALGHPVDRINFVGDWGYPIGKLLAGFELWGDRDRVARRGTPAMDHLFEVYSRFQKTLETEPAYAERATRCLQQLEEGEPKITTLWKDIRETSLASVDTTLRRMGIRFDFVDGESTYVPGATQVLDQIKQLAGARLSEGAWIVDVEGVSSPALVQKKDGTTLYLTRDISAAIDRERRFPAAALGYVVSEQQRLHFQLLFGVLRKMGFAWAGGCEHIAFGELRIGSTEASPRETRPDLLDDLLDEAKTRAGAELAARHPELAVREAAAEAIGVGAVVFATVSGPRGRDLQLDWDRILTLTGDTGPSLQQTLARCRALVGKATAKGERPAQLAELGGYRPLPIEELLIVQLGRLGVVLHACASAWDPFALGQYLIELARHFDRFHQQLPLLQAGDPGQRRVRLNLVEATRQVLENGLRLLGIPCPS
jgi:arginyl-tRNA synthetase